MLNLALVVALQNPTDTITFQSNFESVEKVVERLARESGVPMTSFSGIKNYPIYINVKNVPLQTLMDKIAEVTGAEWEKKKESWFLSASQDLRKKQEKEGDAEMIAAIESAIAEASKPKKSFEEIGKEMASRQDDGKKESQEEMSKMIREMMGSMYAPDAATLSLLRIIGAKDLSTIVEGRRVVLSNNPNQVQVLMNSNAINAIRKFIQEEAAKAVEAKKAAEAKKAKEAKEKAKTKKKKTSDGDDDMDEDFDMSDMNLGGLFGGGGVQNPELVNNLSTIMAAFQINARSVLSVQLSAYTDKGRPLYSKTVQIPIRSTAQAKEPVKGKTKLEVVPSAKAYAQALIDGENLDPIASMITNMGQGTGAMFDSLFDSTEKTMPELKALSSETKAMMLDPVAYEPLAALLGPVLDGIAKNGTNVVALPSDAVFKTLAREVTKPNLTVEGVLDEIDRTITQQVTQDGTWTVMKASSPLELRSAFCNRVALKNLLSNGKTKGYLNLDDCARFAIAQDNHRGSEALALPMVTAALRTSDIGSISALTAAGFDALKFYSTMTDFQKQTLNANRPLALATLTPAQREILGRMVYSGGMPPMESNGEMWKSLSEIPAEAEEAMGGMAAIGMAMAGPMMSAFGMGETKMTNERTILMPNGIPVVGSISMKMFNSQSLVAIDKSKGTSTIAPPEMLAMGDMDMGFMKMPKRNFDEYQMANQQTFMLFFQFGNSASYILPLYDVKVDSSKTYKKSELPAKIQERLKGFQPPATPPDDKDGDGN
jgi:hypothetical protein